MLRWLAKSPKRTRVASLDRIFFDDGRSSITFQSPSDEYLVINRLPPASAAHSGNSLYPPPPSCALDPPIHWHYDQIERFHILEGEVNFYLDGQVQGAGVDEGVIIPSQAFHTFRNASTTKDLVLEFVLDPPNRERDEAFFSI